MRGREFLDAAADLSRAKGEGHWRGAHVLAYYALLLECRDALLGWSFAKPARDNVHSWVRLSLAYSRDTDLRGIADVLDFSVRLWSGHPASSSRPPPSR